MKVFALIAALTYVPAAASAQSSDLQALAHVTQIGEANTALTHQSGAGASLLALSQTGHGNFASIAQIASGGVNQTTVVQTGSDNRIDLVQDGADNIADLTQSGSGNVMEIVQRGSGNALTWSQHGQGLAAPTVVMPGGATVTITQSTW